MLIKFRNIMIFVGLLLLIIYPFVSEWLMNYPIISIISQTILVFVVVASSFMASLALSVNIILMGDEDDGMLIGFSKLIYCLFIIIVVPLFTGVGAYSFILRF